MWSAFSPVARPYQSPSPTDEVAAMRISKYRISARVRPPHDLQAEAELALENGPAAARMVLFELSRFLKVNSVTMQTAAGELPLEFIQKEALQVTQLARPSNHIVAII